MIIKLIPSRTSGKKWDVIFPDGKKVSFGDKAYQDYTQNKDSARMKRYLLRHEKNEDWTNMHTAGFWSKWLLWTKPSLSEAIHNIESKFKIKINRY